MFEKFRTMVFGGAEDKAIQKPKRVEMDEKGLPETKSISKDGDGTNVGYGEIASPKEDKEERQTPTPFPEDETKEAHVAAMSEGELKDLDRQSEAREKRELESVEQRKAKDEIEKIYNQAEGDLYTIVEGVAAELGEEQLRILKEIESQKKAKDMEVMESADTISEKANTEIAEEVPTMVEETLPRQMEAEKAVLQEIESGVNAVQLLKDFKEKIDERIKKEHEAGRLPIATFEEMLKYQEDEKRQREIAREKLTADLPLNIENISALKDEDIDRLTETQAGKIISALTSTLQGAELERVLEIVGEKVDGEFEEEVSDTNPVSPEVLEKAKLSVMLDENEPQEKTNYRQSLKRIARSFRKAA
ncbi:MAG TPA: hypothetical protein VMX18_02840 [Candidatus Bipolaricaulota bacterium]|nr:hypothetical protein [Candidatus Bipolaricaulota bacterium]